MDIAVIGSNMVDLISYINAMPKEGETLEAPDFKIGCGGKGANQAVAAAKMGSKVMMVTKVGADLFADNTIQNLEAFGIDTEFTTKMVGTSSGVAPIFVDQESKNRILIIKGANEQLLPSDVDHAAEKLKTASLIVLQLEIPLPTVYRAIDFGSEHNIPVILNPAPASKELDFNYVCKSDFFIPNESELEILTGMPVATGEQIREAASNLIKKGVKNVIVTMGSRGVMWITKEKNETVASQKVTAVDTTGAGDAFIGCFAHFFVENGDVLQAIKKATAFAGLSVTKRGTQSSYPTSMELEAFLTSLN
ncbi:ribokinase [Peribacillus muralis]|uniref:ribokinase n=1 Tax=Peribacillus muralis TaxID=264697 RepID=UPI001F4DCDB4|nr:ribokinase [Peribacillus muralis]MCK1993790.1 ribokinase [Peribacillus muralis]MCK2013921.1 ribokinase [Peribacillus muralis]